MVEEYPDGRSFSSTHVREIIQDWLDFHMNQRLSEFTHDLPVTVFTGTWNVNAKKQDTSLDDWLIHPESGYADIYAVGFQEIVDLNAVNVALDSSKTQQRSKFWQDKIQDSLDGTRHTYVFIEMKSLVGLLVCVFAKEEVAKHITDVRTSTLSVGLMGVMGNKGGVSIRLSVYDSSIVFVCTHLAAHRENVIGRNNDFKNVIEKLVFVAGDKLKKTNLEDGELIRPKFGASRFLERDLGILDHDIVFWFGDLNYRIDQELDTDLIFLKCEHRDWGLLRDHDQLNIERSRGNVFRDFNEGLLNFPPTYKYLPGSDEYDRRPEKKIRAPAWCDRVLWRSSPNAVRQICYDYSNLMPSDHKPVYSMFEANVKVVDSGMEARVYHAITTELEFWKNDAAIPVVTIEGADIDFGKVSYDTRIQRVIKLTNEGQCMAHWRLVPKLLDGKGFCKRYLSFRPTKGLILPKDEPVEVVVTLHIDAITAQLYNAGRETFQDLVVLRVEKSLDSYIRVVAEYERSCYGMSLEDLVNATVPVRQLPLAAPAEALSSLSSETPKLGVPKELWMLIDALWTNNAVRQRDLFFIPPDAAEVMGHSSPNYVI